MFTTRRINYRYAVRMDWREHETRLRWRKRAGLFALAPLTLALLGGMAAAKLQDQQVDLPGVARAALVNTAPSQAVNTVTTTKTTATGEPLITLPAPNATPSELRDHRVAAPVALARIPEITDQLEDPLASGSAAIELPAPSEDETALWREITVQPGDNMSVIFEKLDLGRSDLDRIMKLGTQTAALKKLKPGQIIYFRADADGRLSELSFAMDYAHTLQVTRTADEFTADLQVAELQTQQQKSNGVVRGSLFEAGYQAGLSDNVIMQLVDMFQYDIDFAQDLQEGDRFTVLYEHLLKDGQKVKDGAVLAAEFINGDKTHRAVRYVDAAGNAGFYTADGKHLQKAFLRTPVAFTRISSRFSKSRYHPILHKFRAHKGVDYAAPTGTPIKAAGDGNVVQVTRHNGYGNMVTIEHRGGYSTLYAHMKTFAKNLKAGTAVRQGQVIGYVGSTGLASGPHLHYEFRVNGEHRDPLKVTTLPAAVPLEGKALAAFKESITPVLAQLDAPLPATETLAQVSESEEVTPADTIKARAQAAPHSTRPASSSVQ